MITAPQVFDDAHIPRELKHREGEVEALSTAFDPATRGKPAGDVLISGPSGVGKTVLARHTVNRLRSHAPAAETHINALGTTTTGILRALVEDYPGGPPVSTNTPRDDLEAIAVEVIDQPYIVVLDEADDLPSTDVLDVLDDLTWVSIVVICHDDERWLARVDDRTRSRLAVHVTPDRYRVDELVDILQPRADQGLQDDVVTNDQLETIADEAAGVARRGIQSLRSAAELAAERGHETIADEDVDDSFERAQRRIRESNLASLGLHHHVVYELIREASGQGMRGSTLHARYERHADQLYYDRAVSPIGRRARRYKLEKLSEYDLVDVDDEEADPVYRVIDESLGSPLDIEAVNA